ncbi:hypothetical protein [Pseudomonas sp. JZ134]|uniref:hypothetical protein n=1 Tax=Pseudomonas sp. JZ134 TaxID=2806615 RepID=UPI003DA1C901
MLAFYLTRKRIKDSEWAYLKAVLFFVQTLKKFTPEQVVTNLFNKSIEKVEYSFNIPFDTRNPDCVCVEQYDDVWVIYNTDLLWPILGDPKHDLQRLYCAIGKPALAIGFCKFDSGDTYGYAFIENGTLTRSRLQNSDDSLLEYGIPKPFEDQWFTANYYLEDDSCPEDETLKIYYLGNREVEVADHGLTIHLAREALEENFKLCPWDNDAKPKMWLFRLHDHCQEDSEILHKKPKPWWRFW